MIAYLFFFHMVHWSFILGQGWLLSNNFCKACQNCLHPSFVIVHNAVQMHELLLCCESSRKCHHATQTTPTWTKTSLTCFTKLTAVQPSIAEIWMNNVPNESRIINHALKSVLLYLFSILRNLEWNPGFLFFLTHTVQRRLDINQRWIWTNPRSEEGAL